MPKFHVYFGPDMAYDEWDLDWDWFSVDSGNGALVITRKENGEYLKIYAHGWWREIRFDVAQPE